MEGPRPSVPPHPPAATVSLPPLVDAPPLVSAPCPSAVDSLIRGWIAKAQQGQPAGGAEEKPLERLKHLFGVLELAPQGGGGGTWASLQVFVQLSQFQKERHVFLHFYQSTERDRQRGTTARLAAMKDRKEAGFVYCDAATGALNGIHIAPEQRGLGLSKPCVLYYVLFCRRFGCADARTSPNPETRPWGRACSCACACARARVRACACA